MNTGHDIRLSLDDDSTTTSHHHVNISGGPLSYHYRVAELVLHFGSTDSRGSEHTIDSLQFPAEVRLADTIRQNYIYVRSKGDVCQKLPADLQHENQKLN